MCLNKYDLEHKLLRGSVLYLGDIPTYKVTLGEMADNGFTTMQVVISILTMDDSKASEMFNADFENPSTFIFIYYSILQELHRIEQGLVKKRMLIVYYLLLFHYSYLCFLRKKLYFINNMGF